MARKDLSLFKKHNISTKKLESLIADEYSEHLAMFSQISIEKGDAETEKYRAIDIVIEGEANELLGLLGISSAFHKCVVEQAVDIIRLLNKYPELLNEFISIVMDIMREIYLKSASSAERDYALENARFIKVVIDINPVAIKICALKRYQIENSGNIDPIGVWSYSTALARNIISRKGSFFSPLEKFVNFKIFTRRVKEHSKSFQAENESVVAEEPKLKIPYERINYSALSQSLILSELSALSGDSQLVAKELETLIATEYMNSPMVSHLLMLEKSGQFVGHWMIGERINAISKELAIDSAPYDCVYLEANNIVRILREYPDLINAFLLMKMRRMKELYLNPANDIEREYALVNARFIKAVVEKNSSAIKICALAQCEIDIFGMRKPEGLRSRIIKFKITESLLTETDFQHHMNIIERVARRHVFGDKRLLTAEERDSGRFHPSQKYFYLRGEELKRYLQKRIEDKSASKKKREPLNYRLNASE